MRKFKKIYQFTSQLKCKGCEESFWPLAFKGHVLNCRRLEGLEESFGAASEQELMVVKASSVDNAGYIKFFLAFCGLSWHTQVKLEEVQFVVRQLKENYPNLSSFTQSASKCQSFLNLDANSLNRPAGLELVNSFVQALARFEVVRNDLSFRILLQVNEKLEEDQKRKGKYHATNSVSLLRIAKQNRQKTL